MAAVDPHSFSDLNQGRVTHLNLEMAVDFQKHVVSVHANYTLDRPVSGPLFLDCRGQKITRVAAGERAIRWRKDAHDPILGDRLHLLDLGGATSFSIELTTAPGASALQWLEPAQTAGGKQPFVYSQCQAIHARSIFPCQDSPGVRMTYEARLRVPRGLMAVMAAAHEGVRHEGDDSSFSFKMPQPIPAYLFAFAAGDLGFKEIGPRTGVYAEPMMLDAAAWEFEKNEWKISEAERLFGPYLWDRYDLLIMPPSFPYGGMENPRLTFLTPGAILGDRSMSTLITHELAHAWTGNLVTNATWEDFWLNEGWTSYAESRISEVVEGQDIAFTDAVVNLELLREDIQELGAGTNLTCLKTRMKGVDPDLAVSTVPYHKGRLFLVALERAVGRKAFDAFIRKYIAAHKFQSLSTEGFVEFLKRELPEAAAKVDLEIWLYKPDLPADTPQFTSPLYDDVVERIAAYGRGVLPEKEIASKWPYPQKRLFLRRLPPRIPAEDCREIGDRMTLHPKANTRLLFEYYRMCIRSEYREAWPAIEAFVEREGRFVFLTSLFRSMAENEWTRERARPLFERVRQRHHNITVAAVEAILKEVGL